MSLEIASFRELIFALGFALIRIGAVFSILPFLSSQFIQGVARNAIMISMSLIVIPLVMPTVPLADLTLGSMTAIAAKEIVIGIIIGFFLGIPYWIMEGTGFFIDNQRGSAMAAVFDPMTSSTTSPMGSLFVRLLTVLVFSSGGFLVLLGVVLQSYMIWPIFSFFPELNAGFGVYFMEIIDHLMAAIVVLAAPIVIVLFLSDFGLGLMNRFAPQLNVFVLSLPVKSGLASFLIVLYLVLLMKFADKEVLNSYQFVEFLKGIFNEQSK